MREPGYGLNGIHLSNREPGGVAFIKVQCSCPPYSIGSQCSRSQMVKKIVQEWCMYELHVKSVEMIDYVIQVWHLDQLSPLWALKTHCHS